MSKSLGNFITIDDLLGKYEADAIRLFLVSTHYRSPVDYSEEALQGATQSLRRIRDTLNNLDQAIKTGNKKIEKDEERKRQIRDLKKRFLQAMDDDFNTAKALAVFFELIRIGNIASNSEAQPHLLKKIHDLIIELGSILGLHLEEVKELSDEVGKLIAEQGSS